eukprot:XP_011433735.1 PREDICTED: multiple epidermal growth factor-like domains protein 10 [Crassostrea gigas]
MFLEKDNIALFKPTWQQSTIGNWGSNLAVDGRKTDLSANGGQCSISANSKLTAEWRVDLKNVSSIHHVTIQYRTDNIHWNASNAYTSRFLGFTLYISNSTDREEGVLCFRDTNFTRATIPNPITITCPRPGRYVIFYNKRTQSSIPAGYDRYAFSELCEVEVYGCARAGFYGEDCYQRCPQNCQEGHCHIVEGTCLGCVPGYKGPTCDEQCKDHTYGLDCKRICGNCRIGDQCHHVNGSCPNGCDRGSIGIYCATACPVGSFGYDCQERCSIHCAVPDRCDRVTGECQDGCLAGWKGVTCDKQCDGGKYGPNCTLTCGHCFRGSQCHFEDGACPGECDSGYEGSRCTKACRNNTYGPACTMACGNCLYLYGEQCNHVTGHCPRGCPEGFKGDLCNNAGESSSYNQQAAALYAFIVLFCLLLLLNIIYIIWNFRNRICDLRNRPAIMEMYSVFKK